MKVLWICNFALPAFYSDDAWGKRVYSGGWVSSMLESLAKCQGVELAVAMIAMKGGGERSFERAGVRYYALPVSGSLYRKEPDARQEKMALGILEKEKPDVVHLQGTEYPWARIFIRPDRRYKVVASIQGLISVISRYYRAGLPAARAAASTTFRDFLIGNSLSRQQFHYEHRGRREREMIQAADCVIGRTEWDRAHAWAISPGTPYRRCDEVLRKEFYGAAWDIGRCSRRTVFLGSMGMPIKGFLSALSALGLLAREMQDVRLIIAGESAYRGERLRRAFLGKTYYNLVSREIERSGLSDRIEWLGPLDAPNLVSAMLSANACAVPSLIENSPNTLAEGMLLGMPCVASCAGGIPSMLHDGQEGLLYRAEEPELLAWSLKRIFEDDELAARLGKNARETAARRHDPRANSAAMAAIYADLAGAR